MNFRIASVAIFLVATAWIVRTVGHGEPARLSQPLSKLPDTVGEWRGQTFRLSGEVEKRLHVSDYVYKIYANDSKRLVHLYVGYYESQKHGEMIHSPKNCLPGNGWYISKKARATLDIQSYPPFEVNNFTVENDSHQQVVLYWYQQSGGRIVTNEYLGRVFLVLDAFTKDRTDAALIRVNIPVTNSVEDSFQTGVQFLKVVYPALMEFLPHGASTQ